MPDSLDSSPTASDEGGSCLTDDSYFVHHSPGGAPVVLHSDLRHDIATVAAMSCLTGAQASRRSKAPRDLNNRWVLLNKDLFQEILNSALNQMTGLEPSPGDHAPEAPPAPRDSQESRTLEYEVEQDKPTDLSIGPKEQKERPKTCVKGTKGSHSKDKRRLPLASVPTRTIIASSAFKKQADLRVVSQIMTYNNNNKDVTAKKASPSPSDGKKHSAKSCSATASPRQQLQQPTAGCTRRSPSGTGHNGKPGPASTTSGGSKRSKVVCPAQSTAPAAAPAEPRAHSRSRGRGVDSSAPSAAVTAGSSTAHGPPACTVTNSTAAEAPTTGSASGPGTTGAVENSAKNSVVALPEDKKSDGMSAVVVAGSPGAPGTSVSSSAAGTNPAVKAPVGQERWVQVSKSTLFDMVDRLVARPAGEDSSADHSKEGLKRVGTDTTTNNAIRCGTRSVSVSDSASTRSDLGSKDSRGVSSSAKNNGSDRGRNSPSEACWVALNKTVVEDIVDEAIMRQLEESDDDNEGGDVNGRENSSRRESGSDHGRQGPDCEEVRPPASPGHKGKRPASSGCVQPRRSSADSLAQPGAVSAATTAGRDGTGLNSSAKQCPQTSRSISPPLVGQQATSGKKRSNEPEVVSVSGASKRKRSASGLYSLSAHLSSERAATGTAAATDTHKALCLTDATRDARLSPTALNLPASQTTSADVALRNLFIPCESVLRLASPAETARVGPAREADKAGLADVGAVMDLRARPALSRDAARVETSPFSRRSAANQSAPTDLSVNDGTGVKLDGRSNSDRAKGPTETLSSNKKDAKCSRDGPESAWVAVSKSDVNSIVDCVVSTMINDDDTVTSPARGEDSRSVSPRSTSVSSPYRDVLVDDATAENVRPDSPRSRTCVQVLAGRQLCRSGPVDEKSAQQGDTVIKHRLHSQSLQEKVSNKAKAMSIQPTSRSTSPSKENDYAEEKDDSGLSDGTGEESEREEPRKAVKWKSALITRMETESVGTKSVGRDSPSLLAPTVRGRPQAEPGSSKNESPLGAGPDRRCSKRASTSGKRRTHHRTTLSLTAK